MAILGLVTRRWWLIRGVISKQKVLIAMIFLEFGGGLVTILVVVVSVRLTSIYLELGDSF